MEELGDTSFVTFRGERVACVELARVLGVETVETPPEKAIFLFLRLASGDLIAFKVDRVFDNEDLVVKPLAPAIMATRIYAGSSLLDDGNPLLMLDIPNIAIRHGLVSQIRTRKTAVVENETEGSREAPQAILFRCLGGKRRAIRMDAVNRIQTLPTDTITTESGRFQAALDGAILPLLGIPGDTPQREHVPVLRLGDGDRELLYAASEIENTADISGEIAPIEGQDLLEGSTLFGDQTFGLIDVHRLFALHAHRSAPLRKLRCSLPQEDGWSRTFLAPLIEAAGYEIAEGEDGGVDIAIVTENEDAAQAGGARVIQLRAAPEATSAGDASIYRYDRDALLSALRAASGER